MTDQSRRAVYRIVYPLIERPTLSVGRWMHEVVDCSERGIRYEVKDRRLPMLGMRIRGVVQFRRGDDVEVIGVVIRARMGMVVLALEPPLPFSEILAEQRYLRSKGYLLKDEDGK
jgi:hypothetical protein